MEPRALGSVSTTPFKEIRENNVADLEKAEGALSELSLNNGTYSF